MQSFIEVGLVHQKTLSMVNSTPTTHRLIWGHKKPDLNKIKTIAELAIVYVWVGFLL